MITRWHLLLKQKKKRCRQFLPNCKTSYAELFQKSQTGQKTFLSCMMQKMVRWIFIQKMNMNLSMLLQNSYHPTGNFKGLRLVTDGKMADAIKTTLKE